MTPVQFSRWTGSRSKRLFDLLLAAPLNVAVLPLLILVAAAVKLSSPGPVFFRQFRCGRGGKSFEFLKFRTMYHDRQQAGPGVTCRGDLRVTPIGRVLRKWKLDELPQFLHVLRGEMSLVGPRPDLPKYFAELPVHQRSVLALTPGITSPATLKYRNEEELMAGLAPSEIETFYLNALLPQKVAIELQYAKVASLSRDVLILLRTAVGIFR